MIGREWRCLVVHLLRHKGAIRWLIIGEANKIGLQEVSKAEAEPRV